MVGLSARGAQNVSREEVCTACVSRERFERDVKKFHHFSLDALRAAARARGVEAILISHEPHELARGETIVRELSFFLSKHIFSATGGPPGASKKPCYKPFCARKFCCA